MSLIYITAQWTTIQASKNDDDDDDAIKPVAESRTSHKGFHHQAFVRGMLLSNQLAHPVKNPSKMFQDIRNNYDSFRLPIKQLRRVWKFEFRIFWMVNKLNQIQCAKFEPILQSYDQIFANRSVFGQNELKTHYHWKGTPASLKYQMMPEKKMNEYEISCHPNIQQSSCSRVSKSKIRWDSAN